MHNLCDAFGPRSRPTGRAALRLAGIAASIAIAGCDTQANLERIQHQRNYDDAYDRCISRNVGAFAAASIEVMHECQRQAKEAVDG